MESHLLRTGVLRMLNEWKMKGGTRRKLLETSQKFQFVGPSERITACKIYFYFLILSMSIGSVLFQYFGIITYFCTE